MRTGGDVLPLEFLHLTGQLVQYAQERIDFRFGGVRSARELLIVQKRGVHGSVDGLDLLKDGVVLHAAFDRSGRQHCCLRARDADGQGRVDKEGIACDAGALFARGDVREGEGERFGVFLFEDDLFPVLFQGEGVGKVVRQVARTEYVFPACLGVLEADFDFVTRVVLCLDVSCVSSFLRFGDQNTVRRARIMASVRAFTWSSLQERLIAVEMFRLMIASDWGKVLVA